MNGISSTRSGPFGAKCLPFHLRSGIRYRIPICCVVHFCWDNVLGRAAGMTRWKQISHDRTRSTFVPCGIFHAGDSPHLTLKRLWRMFRFEWVAFQPTQRGRTWRELAAYGSSCYQASTIEERLRASDQRVFGELWWGES